MDSLIGKSTFFFSDNRCFSEIYDKLAKVLSSPSTEKNLGDKVKDTFADAKNAVADAPVRAADAVVRGTKKVTEKVGGAVGKGFKKAKGFISHLGRGNKSDEDDKVPEGANN